MIKEARGQGDGDLGFQPFAVALNQASVWRHYNNQVQTKRADQSVQLNCYGDFLTGNKGQPVPG